MKNISKNEKCIFLSTFLIGLITHGYILTNKITNHDDIASLALNADGFVYGRWMWKIWTDFGILSNPFFNGMINIVLMSLCAVLITRTFAIKKLFIAIFIGGIWVSFPANTSIFFFTHLLPIYTIGIFCSVLALYFYATMRGVKRYMLSIGFIILSLGCYQAYFAITVAGIVLYLLVSFYRTNADFKIMLKEIWLALLVLGAGLLLYFGVTRVILSYYNISLTTYQGMGNIGDGFLTKFPDMISSAYRTMFTFHSDLQNTILAKLQDIVVPVAFFVCGFAMIFKQIQRRNKLGAIISLILIVIYPAVCNLTYFYGSEFVHTVMQYSNAFSHVAVLVMVDELATSMEGAIRFNKAVMPIFSLLIGIGILQNVLLANREYYAQHRTQMVVFEYLSNVVVRVQSTDGYVQGMPVAFVGYCSDPGIKAIDAGLQRSLLSGIDSAELFINNMIYSDWSRQGTFQFWLGFADQILPVDQSRNLLNDPRVSQMPNYPSDGSVEIIDGVVVVHFSSVF